MEREIFVADVRTFQTKGGNTRYVVRSSDGVEYTTFREAIGEAAERTEGGRARISYHEQQRGQYTNVYPRRDQAARRRRRWGGHGPGGGGLAHRGRGRALAGG